MNESMIWVFGFLVLVGFLAVLVWYLERAKTIHQTELEVLRTQLNSRLEAGVDKSRDLAQRAAKEFDELVDFARTPASPQPQPQPVPTIDTDTGLPSILIDRDDLMKHVGNDYPRPVLLNDEPLHNGLGDPVHYWVWPGKGGIRSEKPKQEGAAS